MNSRLCRRKPGETPVRVARNRQTYGRVASTFRSVYREARNRNASPLGTGGRWFAQLESHTRVLFSVYGTALLTAFLWAQVSGQDVHHGLWARGPSAADSRIPASRSCFA